MSDSRHEPDGIHVTEDPDVMQSLGDEDTTVEAVGDDAAQAEWDRTLLADAAEAEDPGTPTATGDDPAHIPDDREEVPRADLPDETAEPETQGEDPVIAELGEDGQGDLAPEDL